MRRNDAGISLSEVLVIAAILLILAAIAIPNLSRKATPDIDLRGWVRSVNVVVAHNTTYIAFEKEGDITPQSYELAGVHPELWRGEHVLLRLHPCTYPPAGYRYDVVGFKRLGPDAPDDPVQPNTP